MQKWKRPFANLGRKLLDLVQKNLLDNTPKKNLNNTIKVLAVGGITMGLGFISFGAAFVLPTIGILSLPFVALAQLTQAQNIANDRMNAGFADGSLVDRWVKEKMDGCRYNLDQKQAAYDEKCGKERSSMYGIKIKFKKIAVDNAKTVSQTPPTTSPSAPSPV